MESSPGLIPAAGRPEIMPKYRSVANAFTNSEKLARLLSSQMPAISWPRAWLTLFHLVVVPASQGTQNCDQSTADRRLDIGSLEVVGCNSHLGNKPGDSQSINEVS